MRVPHEAFCAMTLRLESCFGESAQVSASSQETAQALTAEMDI
jgi:hypothetical protein